MTYLPLRLNDTPPDQNTLVCYGIDTFEINEARDTEGKLIFSMYDDNFTCVLYSTSIKNYLVLD